MQQKPNLTIKNPKLTIKQTQHGHLVEIVATQAKAKISCYVFASTISGLTENCWYEGNQSLTRSMTGIGIASVGVLVGKRMTFYVLVISDRTKPYLLESLGTSFGSFQSILTNGNDFQAEKFAAALHRSSHDLQKYVTKHSKHFETLFYSTPSGLVVVSTASKSETILVTSSLVKLIKDQEQNKLVPALQARRLLRMLNQPLATVVGDSYQKALRTVTSITETGCHIEHSRVNVDVATHVTGKRSSLSIRAYLNPPGVERAS